MGDSFDDNRIQKLFEHAIDSVEMGVEDYVASSEDQRRIMSSVRNVDSGLELLCKVYIGKDGVKAILDGNGDHTIGMRKIRNVLMNQKIMMEPFVALRGYRDNVEHFFPSDREVARQYLENSLSWMIEFMTKRLHRKPHEAFSPKIWDILCREQAIMQEERRKMEDEFSELDLPHPEMSGLAPYYFRCPDCRSMIVDVVKERRGDANFCVIIAASSYHTTSLWIRFIRIAFANFAGSPL